MYVVLTGIPSMRKLEIHVLSKGNQKKVMRYCYFFLILLILLMNAKPKVKMKEYSPGANCFAINEVEV